MCEIFPNYSVIVQLKKDNVLNYLGKDYMISLTFFIIIVIY